MNTKVKQKVYPLHGDLMFKHIFGYQNNVDFTEFLLETLFYYNYRAFKNLKIKNSVKLDQKTVRDKKFETDVLVELPTGEIINLEMYTKYDRNASIKSVMYVTSIFSSQLKISEDYNLTKQVTQINFVKDNKYKNEKMIKKYTLVEQNSLVDKIIPELFQIIVINVASEEKILYNKREKDFYLLMKLINAETLEEMEEIVKGNEMMEKILEEMKRFSEEEYVQDYHAQEVLIKSQHNSEMQELEQNYKAQETLIKSQHNSEMKELEQNYKAQETLIKSQHNSEMKELEQNYKAQETLIKSQHNNEMKESKEEVVRKMLLKGFNDSDIIDVTNISSKDLEKIKVNMKEA